MSASSKIQPASEHEKRAREEILPTVDLGKLRVTGRMIPAKGKRARAQSSVPRSLS